MEPSIIENYVGLYIGGKVFTGETGLATNLGLFYEVKQVPGTDVISPMLGGISLFFNKLGDHENKLAVAKFDECKLALRSLMSMTDQEAIQVARWVYFDKHPELEDIRADKRGGDKWFIYHGDLGSDHKVCIVMSERRLGIFNATSNRYDEVPFKDIADLTPWFLDNQFDLYRLIEMGVAVDINTLGA